MPVAGALLQFLRLRGGQTVWTVATGAVPSLSLLAGEPLWIAAALFWAETVLASLAIGVRVGIVAWVARRRGDHATRTKLVEIGQVLGLLVGGFNGTLGIIGGFILFAGSNNGAFTLHDVPQFVDRLRWLVIALASAAAFDTVLAPSTSLRWLQSVAAWQWSRTAVLLFALFIAGVAGLIFGERAALWGFLSLRVLTDIGALRASERERIRDQVFGPLPT